MKAKGIMGEKHPSKAPHNWHISKGDYKRKKDESFVLQEKKLRRNKILSWSFTILGILAALAIIITFIEMLAK